MSRTLRGAPMGDAETSDHRRAHPAGAPGAVEQLPAILAELCGEEFRLAVATLFAASSLKNGEAEGGLDADQAELVRGWKRQLLGAASQHLANLGRISATGVAGDPPDYWTAPPA